MKHSHLIKHLQDDRILAAIHEAETNTTAHIRVLISKRSYPDALAAAEKHFKILKLDHSAGRNTVLIFVAPKSQTFAIYGDAATHAICGPEFWNTLRDDMAAHLKNTQYNDAILHAIGKAGELLARHFPREPKADG